MDAAVARQALARRMLRCPGCGAALKPWGQARPRTVRDLDAGLLTVRPDRARCTACRRTHVVLGVGLLLLRADATRFLCQALVGAVRGHGHRQIAAGQPRLIGVQAVVALDPEALPGAGRGDPLAHAIEALVAAAVAVRRCGSGQRDLWSQIAVLTRGRLLAPSPAG
ncbi:hypothetical protein JHN63_49755 [Streptomyces sp. MBT65]|uniref:hypothetical protein n=1 Tax=Streptomyces sp. MBT65 TaxID=1488395 RepID=UPI00190A9A15|nr:hypothetical protein [Streptomyces sp. MBT65]MBK3581708.1 hypothetical protein [Streptomyces sp. MBT65]